jgi:hypothetical protein
MRRGILPKSTEDAVACVFGGAHWTAAGAKPILFRGEGTLDVGGAEPGTDATHGLSLSAKANRAIRGGLLATAALAGLSLTVAAPASQAVSPKLDSVRGTAEHLGADPPFPVIKVRINARSGATGTEAKGNLDVDGAPPIVPYRGRVTCLNVVGTTATIGIEIVTSSDPAQEGRGQLWSVVDGARTGSPDRIAGYPITPTPPTECPPLFFTVPVVSGGYDIHDAAP